jgi:hypothetical protein
MAVISSLCLMKYSWVMGSKNLKLNDEFAEYDALVDGILGYVDSIKLGAIAVNRY